MSVDMQSEVQQHELRRQQMQQELQKQKAAYSELTSDEKIDKLLDMNTITQINEPAYISNRHVLPNDESPFG